MKPLWRPDAGQVLPIGLEHGHSSTTRELLARGYTWTVEGNEGNPEIAFSAQGIRTTEGYGLVYGGVSPSGVAPTTFPSFLLIRTPLPIVVSGMKWNFPTVQQGAQPPNGFQVMVEGLDMSADPQGVWRILHPSFHMVVNGSGGVGIGAIVEYTCNFNQPLFPVSGLRLKAPTPQNSPLGMVGLQIARILSIF